MNIAIEKAVSFHTFDLNALGLGLVALHDTRITENGDGNAIFAHRLYEDAKGNLTDEQRAEIKADSDALVKLLKKFYHTSEFVAK